MSKFNAIKNKWVIDRELSVGEVERLGILLSFKGFQVWYNDDERKEELIPWLHKHYNTHPYVAHGRSKGIEMYPALNEDVEQFRKVSYELVINALKELR